MATESITSFDDLLGLLERNPQYRSRLRQSILDEEFQRLPQRVDALAEQTRTLGEITTSLAQRMDQFAEQMDQFAERMDQFAEQMDQFAERMDQFAERMDQFAEQMREQSDQIKDIVLHLKNVDARFLPLEKRMDRLMGDEAERRFRGHAPAYFGHLMRRMRVVDSSTLADKVDDAIDAGTFAEADRDPLLLLDVVVRGRDIETREERYLAAEVSVGIGEGDILRAVDRAALLQKLTGIPAVPVVGGYSISPRFRCIADERHVQVVIAEEPK
jgi:DNA-binding ferritin-like protein